MTDHGYAYRITHPDDYRPGDDGYTDPNLRPAVYVYTMTGLLDVVGRTACGGARVDVQVAVANDGGRVDWHNARVLRVGFAENERTEER